MAEASTVRTKQDGILTITNGSFTYTVAAEAGDLSVSIPGFNVTNPLDRGRMTSTPIIRRGDDQPMSGSFSIYLRDTPNATDLTLLDLAMELSGTVAAGYTGTTSNSDVKTWTLSYTIDGTWNGESDRTITLPNSVLRCDIAEGDPTTGTINFTSYQPFPTFS